MASGQAAKGAHAAVDRRILAGHGEAAASCEFIGRYVHPRFLPLGSALRAAWKATVLDMSRAGFWPRVLYHTPP